MNELNSVIKNYAFLCKECEKYNPSNDCFLSSGCDWRLGILNLESLIIQKQREILMELEKKK